MSTINRTIFESCADPDFSKPLPGDILQFTPPTRPQTCRAPIGLLRDPWDAKVFTPCMLQRTLPPQFIFDGVHPYPRVF